MIFNPKTSMIFRKKMILLLRSAKARLDSRRGFTLIELLIVVSIIGILVTIVVPRYKGATLAAGEAALKKDLFIFRDVIDQFYADHGKYPGSLRDLVVSGYIRSIPKDPFTQSDQSWVEIMADGEEGGVADVHSGSDLVARDGTAYNDW